MGILLRVLLIEDSEDDAVLLLRELRRSGYEPMFERVDTAAAMNAALEQQTWDIVISDYSMPQFSAPAALTLLQEKELDLPFIIVSGAIGENTAVAAMRAGAHDFILKGNLARLVPAIDRELREVAERRERKRAEEALRLSEERLRLALEVARVGTWDWNMLTNKVTWSHNYELLFGLTPGTFGATYESVLSCVHPEDRQLVASAVTSCLKKRVCYEHEFRIVWPDGSIRWLAGKGQVFYDETGTTAVRMIGMTMNITDRKQAADQIKASLKEKEVLLKEIHHRVKNNMQVICSLLNLQAASISDPQTLALLQEGQNRVASMALVHEQLYQSKDLARIDFAEYIQNLTANLFSSYDVILDRLALKINVDNIHLSVDAAIPCGLIINELVSNSLKYAFPDGQFDASFTPVARHFAQRGKPYGRVPQVGKPAYGTDLPHASGSSTGGGWGSPLGNSGPPGKPGEIRIEFHSDNDNHLTLSVSDNGTGFPPDLDFRNTETLGLQLVTALTGQLEGTIVLNRNKGTEFQITFQDKSKAPGN